MFVCKLRRKLALAGPEDLIDTIWDRGYTIREAIDEDVAAFPQVATTVPSRRLNITYADADCSRLREGRRQIS